MEIRPIGLYVHIPFCKRKCNYCDFCSTSASPKTINKYVDALIAEIKGYKAEPRIKLDTIFFGGGTPSILESREFEKIASAVEETFEIVCGAEFSVEVNPATVSAEKLAAFVRCGVNRISIGVQSIHENELKKLGRIHTCEDFEETFKLARDAGIGNISLDLMYGIPQQTRDSFAKTLERALLLSPEHISCYGLIVEEGTPFYLSRDTLELPCEDEEYEMYKFAHEALTGHGFSHYEISNYAKDGCECRHNMKYWRDEEYVGVGLSAHSYYRGKRFYNTDRLDVYFSDSCEEYRIEESGVSGIDPFEYAMLGLRLSSGFSLSEYKKLFGLDFTKGKEELLKSYINGGFMKMENGRISFTYEGFYVSNAILAELL